MTPNKELNKKSGLGRNLNALLGKTKLSSEDTQGVLKIVPIHQLQPGKHQPRKQMDSEVLQELADSIRQQGILQPIVARSIGYEHYEIIAGERRWRAAHLAELQEVPVLLYAVTDQKALAFALIENIQRENLSPIEEAYALQRLIKEFGLTHQQTAEAVGKSRANVTNLLRLLNLSASVKQWLEEKKMEMGHARALLILPAEQQHQVAQIIIQKGLSVRETEQLVKSYQNKQTKRPSSKAGNVSEPNLENFQLTLSERLGAKVIISHSQKGTGSLTIYYNSLIELDGILEHIT